jgi:hypothetical protein
MIVGMAFESKSIFRVHHLLRIKGFATVPQITEITGFEEDSVLQHLKELLSEELVIHREARGMWQLSPVGKTAHIDELKLDTIAGGYLAALAPEYPSFLALNDSFKVLCGDWQLKEGQPNDHSDPAYDKKQIIRLGKLDTDAQKICKTIGKAAARFSRYSVRLSNAKVAVENGEHKRFTGVMCESYHDVWMELHEDLILTQGINRAAEGSF